jgi:hypothetical protein
VTKLGLFSLHDQPPSQRPAGWKLFGGVTAAVLALCCGGFLGLGLLVDDPGANRAAVAASAEAGNPVIPPVQATSVITEITSSPKAGNTSTPSAPVSAASPSRSGGPATVRSTAEPMPVRTTKPAPIRTATTPAPEPEPTTATPTPTADPTRQGVTPGAFCSPEGAYGIGKKNGRLYQCRSVDDDQARWKRVRS